MHHSKNALGLLGLCLAGLFAAAPAQGQTPPITYPPSRSAADVAAWLQHDTPLALSQVVDVNPSAVTAITTASPMGQTRGFLAAVSSEAMDPTILDHDGIASWSIPVEVDCERRMVRLGAMIGFRSRDLRTDPKMVRAADTNWVNPSPKAPLGSVVRALCDRDFQRPLIGRKLAAAPHAPAAGAKGPQLALRPELPPPAPQAATLVPPSAPATATPSPAPSAPPAEASPPPKAAAKPRPIKTGSSPWVAQIGASPSLPDIQGQLNRFKKKFATDLKGLDARAVTVQVDGKAVNRALVSGFAGMSDAETFCKRLTAARHPCLVRR
jgi:hypothetical protein